MESRVSLKPIGLGSSSNLRNPTTKETGETKGQTDQTGSPTSPNEVRVSSRTRKTFTR